MKSVNELVLVARLGLCRWVALVPWPPLLLQPFHVALSTTWPDRKHSLSASCPSKVCPQEAGYNARWNCTHLLHNWQSPRGRQAVPPQHLQINRPSVKMMAMQAWLHTARSEAWQHPCQQAWIAAVLVEECSICYQMAGSQQPQFCFLCACLANVSRHIRGDTPL